MDISQAFCYHQRSERACLSSIQLGAREDHRDSSVETSGTNFYESTQILAYADDIDIIGLRHSYVAEAFQGIEQATKSQQFSRMLGPWLQTLDLRVVSLHLIHPSNSLCSSANWGLLSNTFLVGHESGILMTCPSYRILPHIPHFVRSQSLLDLNSRLKP